MPLTRGHTKRARGEPAEPPKQRVQKVCDDGSTPSTERWAEAAVEVAATAAAAAATEAVTEAAVVMAGGGKGRALTPPMGWMVLTGQVLDPPWPKVQRQLLISGASMPWV